MDKMSGTYARILQEPNLSLHFPNHYFRDISITRTTAYVTSILEFMK